MANVSCDKCMLKGPEVKGAKDLAKVHDKLIHRGHETAKVTK